MPIPSPENPQLHPSNPDSDSRYHENSRLELFFKQQEALLAKKILDNGVTDMEIEVYLPHHICDELVQGEMMTVYIMLLNVDQRIQEEHPHLRMMFMPELSSLKHDFNGVTITTPIKFVKKNNPNKFYSDN